MKKIRVTAVLWIVFVIGFYGTSLAQQRYVAHTVKDGETIYSIAKYYRVTPYSILQENVEVKRVEELRPNTILIVPVHTNYQGKTTTKAPIGEVIGGQPKQIQPIGYKRHRVRKRETLYSLTQRYGLTEEQIKRYNKALYSERLKKGMLLQIPEYPEVEEDEERELDFGTYVVRPKETRWSIAHTYGISVDSLLVLNPSLSKNTSYLAVGQVLKLPTPKGDSLKGQEVVLFESYTVPKSMGLFRVGQNYGISVDSVLKLNPEINEMEGLKEGMVLRLPKPKPKSRSVNTENYIFYEVRPKQNIFRLTKNLKISRDSLYLFNPELENGLKAGMVLKLPMEKSDVLDVKDALVLDKFNLIDSLRVGNRPSILIMLPFRLDRINFDNPEKTENQVASRKDITYAMGLYTGALVAVDSIKKMGLSVNLKVLDTELDLEKVKLQLSQQPLLGVDAIFGPVDPGLLGEVAVQANNNNIPVIAPFASKSELSLSNVFYTNPSTKVLRERMLEHIEKRREGQSIIVVADQGHQEAKDSILARFPMAKVAKMSKDGSLHLVNFQTMLSEQEENWVFVETDQPNLAASVTSILNASNTEVQFGNLGRTKKVVVKMFTTNYNSAFEGKSVSIAHLSNLDFTFPSVYRMVENNAFTKAYLKKFGHVPDRYAVRGFDLMLDLLLKLGYGKNLFESAQLIGETEYSGNRFNYFNDWSSGFFNKATYLMYYDDLRIKQLKTK